MNRKCFFALMLLWLISMVSGCFNKQGNAAFEPQETVFTNGAFSLALPCELSNQVIVNPSESFYITDQTVFSVFHADTFAAENLGWIFSICRYTESEYCEEYLQSESRQYVFARDEWGYYCVLFPSDVQSLDPTVNSFMENVRQNELDGILDDFISRNALEEYGEKSLGAYEEIESNEEEKPNTTMIPNFSVLVCDQPTWAGICDWFYSNSMHQKTMLLSDFCNRAPLEECITSLLTNSSDVILIPCNDEILEGFSQFRAIPIQKDAIVFVRNNSSELYNLNQSQIVDAYTTDAQIYWDRTGGEPIIPSMGYLDLEVELWQELSMCFDLVATSKNIVSAADSDNPAQAIIEKILNGTGVWPYYFSLLTGEVGINGSVVTVDGVYPSAQTILNEDYPYTLSYYAIFSSQNPYCNQILDFVERLESVLL